MDPQNTQTPAPDVEPPTIGNLDKTSSIASVAGASANNYVATPTIAQSAVTTVDLPRKPGKLRAVLIAIAVIVLIAGAGLAVFYFAFRTPDSEYDALLRNLKSMREDAKMIPMGDAKLSDNYAAYINESRRNAAKSYIEKLEKVKNSPVLKNDNLVQKAYESDKKVLEEYGESSLESMDTAVIMQKIASKCDTAFERLGEVSTMAQFDKLMFDCQLLMDENPHVPRKSFDEAYYVPLIAAYKQMIKVYRPAYEAYIAKQYAKVEAMSSELELAQAGVKEVTSNKPVLANTKNPTYILDDIIKTAEQRKALFFRP